MDTTRVLLCTLSLLFACAYAQIAPGAYSNEQNLSPDYKIYWSVENDQVLRLALEVNTVNWVGFGIGEAGSGAMPGADFVTIIPGEDGEFVVEDRHATQFAMPIVDTCQDWEVISASQANGMTIVELSRLLDTGDVDNDRAITPGRTNVLWAYGESKEFAYHGPLQRGLSTVTFISTPPIGGGPPPPTPSSMKSLQLRFANHTVPNNQTAYMCQNFRILDDDATLNDTDHHLLEIDIDVPQNLKQFVHHILVYEACPPDSPSYSYLATPEGCNNACVQNVIFAWAPGVGSMELPPGVGFRMGGQEDWSLKEIVMEVHYNNLQQVSGVSSDQLGSTLRYTPELVQHDAGVLWLGDVAVSDSRPIPAAQPAYHREYNCPSACTQFLPHDLNVFSHFPHMHQTGKQFITTYRSGGEQSDPVVIDRTDYYSFDIQRGLLTPGWTISPGDVINTHCVFNTLNLVQDVVFGQASFEEMCIDFLYYWPRLLDGTRFCGAYNGTESLCGLSPLFVENPSVKDSQDILQITYGEEVECDQCQLQSVCDDAAASMVESTFTQMIDEHLWIM